MKRSKLSYDEWKCIKSKKILGKKVENEIFEGYIGLVEIEEVHEKQIWKFEGEDIVVCDKGLKWLSILPWNNFYCITAMLNEKNEILLWYIDMIAEQGIAEDGIPYFDDLYLDLVVYPNGAIKVDDMDELEEALLSKDITKEQFELAISTGNRLKAGLLNNVEDFKGYTLNCLRLVEG